MSTEHDDRGRAQDAHDPRGAAVGIEPSGEIAQLRAALAAAEDAASRAREGELRALELAAGRAALEEIVVDLETQLRDARARIAELAGANEYLETQQLRAAEREQVLIDLEAQLASMRRRAEARVGGPSEARPRRPERPLARTTNGGGFLRAVQSAAPGLPLLEPAALELASRRFQKLRRDPKLFLAHSRFEIARKLSRLL